jgi:hypothetical protein
MSSRSRSFFRNRQEVAGSRCLMDIGCDKHLTCQAHCLPGTESPLAEAVSKCIFDSDACMQSVYTESGVKVKTATVAASEARKSGNTVDFHNSEPVKAWIAVADTIAPYAIYDLQTV